MPMKFTFFFVFFVLLKVQAQEQWLPDGHYRMTVSDQAEDSNPYLEIDILGERCLFWNGTETLNTVVIWMPNQCFAIPGYTSPLPSEKIPEIVAHEPKPFIRVRPLDAKQWEYQIEIPGDPIPITKGKLLKM